MGVFINRRSVWAVSGGVLLVAIVAVGQSGITDIWFAATGAASFDASKAQYMKNDIHMTSGTDNLRFQNGDDNVYLGDGDDIIYMGPGNDRLDFNGGLGSTGLGNDVDTNTIRFWTGLDGASQEIYTQIQHDAPSGDLDVQMATGDFIITLGTP